MSQAEIYQILREEPAKWFSSIDIQKHIPLSQTSIEHNFSKMRKMAEVDYKKECRKVNARAFMDIWVHKFKE